AYRTARQAAQFASTLVAVDELLGKNDLLASIVPVTAGDLGGEGEPDGPRVMLDAVEPLRLQVIEDLFTEVAARALELQEDRHAEAISQPRLQVRLELTQSGTVVAQRLVIA